MAVVDRLRLMALALGTAIAMMACWLTADRALAVGDANEPTCPAATESSPGFRASLPDCRAYEIVSEADSSDLLNVVGSFGFPEGLHVFYNSFLPIPGEGARSGLPERFLATRSSLGWMQQAISPPQSEGLTQISAGEKTNSEGVVFSGDFSQAFVSSPFRNPFEEPMLNETTGVGVYRLSLASGAVTTLSLPDSGVLTQSMIETPAYAEFAEANGLGMFLAGASSDGSRAFFVTTAKLTTAPGTPQDTHEASNELYERMGGHTYLVGVLPDGSVPNCGAELGQDVASTPGEPSGHLPGAIAPSGANVVFSTPGPRPLGQLSPCNEPGLYLRDVVHGSTVRLPGTGFAARAGTGAGDEETIITDGSGKLYEYHVDSGESVEVGEGELLAYSPDGSHVYYLGPEEGVYLWHEGASQLVPNTQAGGYHAGPVGNGPGYGDVTHNMPVTTPHGSHLLFIDGAKLTEYENEGHLEAYIYDAESGEVTCISCKPGGSPLEGEAHLIDGSVEDVGEQRYQNPSPPFISEDGSRAVFETTEALLPQDVNGTTDVYEWALVGRNGCTEESATYSTVRDGCLYLLSSGLGEEVPNLNGLTAGTHLVGASENLEDVYVQTSESLLPGLDNASKLYDLRVDGGFPYTQPGEGCEAGHCKASGGEAAMPAQSTTKAIFGAGNLKGLATRAGRRSARLLRQQKLRKALKACRRIRSRSRREHCVRRVRRRYRPKARSTRRGGAGDGGGAR